MVKYRLFRKKDNLRRRSGRSGAAVLIGLLLLLFGTVPSPQNAPAPQPPAPKLSILLLMDVSGSMADNNKIEQAKAAAISAIANALGSQPQPASQPSQTSQTASQVAPVIAGLQIPGLPVEIAQKFAKNLTALEKLQQVLGPDIRSWVSKAEAQEMGNILKNCNKLMEGLAFEQKSELMKHLNPLVEKMHYSIAAKVNQELGGGLKYVLPGKTPANPEFGGLFTLKPSDHDAIYLGAADKADEAIKLHKALAKTYGDDFLNLTESCLESSRLTMEKLPPGALPEAYQKFSGSGSNLDWMRTKSGSKWVQEYVDKAGTVVDLDTLDDATNIKKSMRQLSSYTDDELRALGVSLDRSSLQSMGYNLGLQSDFERQLALNQARKGLEKGLQAAATEDSAMLMAKYGPRYKEIVEGTGLSLERTPWKGYVDDLANVGKKAKAGMVLDAADKAIIDKFDNFAKYVRESSLNHQINQYANIKKAWSEAFSRGDRAAANALRSQMTGLLDDTQGALHNFQQLYGDDVVKKMLQNVSQGQDDMASLLAKQLESPWVVNEQSIEFCAKKELASQGKLPSPGSTVPSKVVISDAQSLWQYAKQNPGHVFAKAAQYGAYAWMGYEIYGLLKEGKDAEALKTAGIFAGMEGAGALSNYMLAAKFGPWAAPGVVLAGAGGFMIGNMAAQWMINSKVDEMSLQMMTGFSNDGSQFFNDPGMLEYMAKARLENVTNPNTGQVIRDIQFDAPSEAASLTDDQIMSMFKPGTYGDSTIEVDGSGNVTIQEYLGEKPVYTGQMGLMMLPDYKVTTLTKNQIIAHQRLMQMYQAMREKYNTSLDSGLIRPGGQTVPDEFSYIDPHASFPGSEFMVPNKGGLDMHEFTFYRMMFEETWKKWGLDKNEKWADSAYWGSTMENAYKAKWSMFKTFINAMSEGKVKDREFQEKLRKDSPENLLALKMMVEQGIPFYVNGKKLTSEDVQQMIEKKLEERQKILEKIRSGLIHVTLPQDLEQLLQEIGSMFQGDVEIGIVPYSGDCSTTFSLFGFSQNAAELKSAIESLSAGGGTPMTPALYQARHALLTKGRGQAGTIILLCDGQNDCSENPVEAADHISKRVFPASPGGTTMGWIPGLLRFQLVPSLYALEPASSGFVPIDMSVPIPQGRQNMPITVSTVGFQVSDDQQRVLDEIAAAGGGISGSAQNIAQLTQAFSSAIRQASATPIGGGGGGGGGGYVIGYKPTNWPVIILVGFLVLSTFLAVAILAIRRRRSYERGATPQVYAYLDVAYPDGGYKSFPVQRTTFIGRDSNNLLILNDEEVSSSHAELVVSSEGYLLRDLGSTNGTFVNGIKVTQQYLAAGDQIRMGNTLLVFKR